MMPLLSLLLAPLAAAQGSPAGVLHSKGTPAEALADVNRALRGSEARAELVDQPVGDLRLGPPRVIGGGAAERCVTPPSSAYVPGADLAGIQALQAEIVRHVNEDAPDQAAELGKRLISTLPCSRDAIEGQLLGHIYLVQGIASARLLVQSPPQALSYQRDATSAFSLWRQFTPDDREVSKVISGLSEQDGRSIARAVLADQRTSTSMDVVPEVSELWIDGISRSPGGTQRLTVGPHLVQVRLAAGDPVQSLWVRLDASGPATLVLPELLPEDVLEWVEDPARRGDLALSLGVLGGGDYYVLSEQGRIWGGVAGLPESWALVGRVGPDIGRVTLWSGLGLTAAGAAGLGVTCVVSRSRYPSLDLPWSECGPDLSRAHSISTGLWAVALGGGGVAGVGLGLTLWHDRGTSLRIALLPTLGGGQATLRLTPEPGSPWD